MSEKQRNEIQKDSFMSRLVRYNKMLGQKNIAYDSKGKCMSVY